MIVLKKEDCYCSIVDFYKNVALAKGCDQLQILTMVFDCSKIRVTKPVQDEIWAFYRDTEGARNVDLAMLWVQSGPKTSLEGEGYAAECQEGFLLYGADVNGKFPLGDVVATVNVAWGMESDRNFEKFVESSFTRFRNGDWGDMCAEDKRLNEKSLKNDYGRLHGAYAYPGTGQTIWIITEADRSVTTILFPYEY